MLERAWRLFGSTRPVRTAGHPRELLKAATNTWLAIVALLVASVCIVLTVRYDTASEQATSQRERQLVGLFFDQLRLNLTSQMAGIANGFQVPSGRSVRETLQSVHVSIVENTLIAPGSLEVFLLQDEELIDAISLGSSDPRQSFEIIREPVRQLTGLFGKGALFSHSDWRWSADGLPSFPMRCPARRRCGLQVALRLERRPRWSRSTGLMMPPRPSCASSCCFRP